MPGRLEFDLGFGRAGRPRDDEQTDASAGARRLQRQDSGRATAAGESADACAWTSTSSTTSCGGCAAADARRPVRSGSSSSTTFTPTGCTPGSTCSRPCVEARANPPAANDDLLGRLLGKPAEPAARARHRDGRRTRRADPQHRRAAHRQGHLGADQAVSGGRRCRDRGADAHAAARPGVPVARSGLARSALVDLEPGARREPAAASVRRDARRTARATSSRRRARSRRPASIARWSTAGATCRAARAGRHSSGCSTSARRTTDIGLLAALGLIASHAGGPLLAGADPALAGDDAGALAAWQALRRSEAAPWIGLAAPRVLLRLPYGKGSDPIEAFAFEEFAGAAGAGRVPVGQRSLAIGAAHRQAFTARGWDMEPGDEREIGDLPAYTFVRDGEREMQACGERFLTESEIRNAAEGRTRPRRQPPRSQCGGRGPLSVGGGSAGAAGLVTHAIVELPLRPRLHEALSSGNSIRMPTERHSIRSATRGSTRDARRAGTNAAASGQSWRAPARPQRRPADREAGSRKEILSPTLQGPRRPPTQSPAQ